jgi:hypothetical protein
MLIPLGSAWSSEQEPWRAAGWRWWLDPMPINGRQTSFSDPIGYFHLSTPESRWRENYIVEVPGAFEKVSVPTPDNGGDNLDFGVIAGNPQACTEPVAAPAPPRPLDGSFVPSPPPPFWAERRMEPIGFLQSVPFEFDQSRLMPFSRRVLDKTAQKLQEIPCLSVEVEGHADAIGMPVYHLGLGNRCREIVKRDRVVQHWIDLRRRRA